MKSIIRLNGMHSVAFLIAFSFFVASCATPFIPACRDIARDPQGMFKWTGAQARVACSRAQLYADPHLTSFNKEENKWVLNPNGLSVNEFTKVMEDQAESLNDFLVYTNKRWARFIDMFPGFREGLEKEEAKIKWILQRLHWVKTYNEFTDLVGELPPRMQSEGVSYFFPAGSKFISMRVYYPRNSIESIPFSAEYLKVAKRDGTLKQVASFEVEDSQDFAKKVPDLYDPNEFTWKSERRGWKIVSYKVMPDSEEPGDNVVHYIEVFRKTKDLSRTEEKPAVRGFLAAGASNVSVFVIDYDREGTPGYGSPDKVEKVFQNITTGGELFTDTGLRNVLLNVLYDSPKDRQDKPERKKPVDPVIYADIVKMGEVKVDVWEEGTWSVPFDYKTLDISLDIIYEIAKNSEDMRLEEKKKLKQIAVFKREFKQSAEVVVVELWKPKPEYAERNIADSSSNNYKGTFTIRRKGGREEVAEIESFAENIKVIAYLFGGRWFSIVDEDGDGVFEKKRSISDPTKKSTSPVTDYDYM